eukprot:TRINITY_DN11912_c0_g2_i1.p1 TRINITY_DN11912_c0_g2~~TRINITY_DN11912_c0_g2_i1.p1  ORF type:complete len:594 (+),score=204.61 TRINITY_DN11912_c0_g2_i1:158-1939(+)
MGPKKSAGEISQTVDESNELRKKLGIKPLAEGKSATKAGSSNEPVHAPADAKKAVTEKDAKKKAQATKARKEHEVLTTGDSLGDILAREEGKDGAADWIAKTRASDGSMKGAAAAAAAAKAKEESERAAKKRKEASNTEALKMKVRHDNDSIRDGESVIMTLSDQRLLDKDGKLIEQEDELSNVNLNDKEKYERYEAIRNKREYEPTKEGADILDKYDDVKTGPTGFMIGGTAMGVIEEQDPEKRLQILTKMSESDQNRVNFQSDYYTSEEMEKLGKFTQKSKKKKPKRKRQGEDKEDTIGDPKKVHVPAARPDDAGSDEEDPELYEQLSKQRRLVKRADSGTAKKGEAALAAVSESIQTLNQEEEEKKEEVEKEIVGEKKGDTVALTATTEFCNIVQTPLEKIETLKHESFKGSTLYKTQAAARKGVAAGERKARKAGMTGKDLLEGSELDKQIEDEIAETLQEDELDMSCASGLEYLRARSQIGNDQESHKIRKLDNRPLEMSTADGDIKLEYRDDYGRVQTPKEAFRAISWKFHGKTPGRKNMERRLLRLENEMKLKSMNTDDLPTLRALKHVQTADAKPYMVLSGANEK